ncbi:nuclear transport factor 2 family protein [Streptomyces sp. Z26]|uniref:nuclear transport factor 2 family protein n=1 Tax=Streptomyces sp. Z26 TaxID=2500177 RepID=UPI000EF17365|nr:nuclear transport factor 2 family protein [Streptomyces sp. Z26]
MSERRTGHTTPDTPTDPAVPGEPAEHAEHADHAERAELADPAELFRHGLRLLLDKDIDGWVALWDEDGTMEFPFAPPRAPSRLDGRAEVAAYMREYPDQVDLRAIPHLEIHRTQDPGTIVVEMRATGRLVVTDSPYEMAYVAVVTVRNGRFHHYRDYWNPLGLPDSWHAEDATDATAAEGTAA